MKASIGELRIKDKTEEKLNEVLIQRKLSDKMMEALRTWIIFEEEAHRMMAYLRENPEVTEKEIYRKIFDIVADYANKIGIGQGYRECLSGRW